MILKRLIWAVDISENIHELEYQPSAGIWMIKEKNDEYSDSL